eukprot:Nk52_evm19s211 gene=Nk52_evmTU19s211
MAVLTSAAGVIALLDEPQPELRVYALEKLNCMVDIFWAEISEAIEKIEIFYEDEAFPQRKLASLIASKVYYHLGEFDDSLSFALGAGELFEVDSADSSEFVNTIIAKCIDKYISLRLENLQAAKPKPIDSRLEAIVNGMFEKCFKEKEYRQAIGISLETRRLDIFERAVKESPDMSDLLSYCMKICMTLVQSRAFRNNVLRILVKLYSSLKTPDHIRMSQCLIFLDESERLAEVLKGLISAGESESLMAFQVAFDVFESATQHFVSSLRSKLPKPPAEAVAAASSSSSGKSTGGKMDVDGPSKKDTFDEKLVKLDRILSGEITITTHQEFLFRNKNVDLLVLNNTKNAVVRNNVCHTAIVACHAILHMGTTVDTFLRDNLEWLARATNWAKFGATASLGVIHKGHIGSGHKILQPYLPQPGVNGSAYSEGGSLFAMGLIHANHGEHISKYLLTQLKTATSEVVQHGACLGVGVACMATESVSAYEDIKNILYTDNAVAGEAAGIAMGLVMLGTNNAQALDEMVQYARETQHEKIIRGLAIGVSMVVYGMEESADGIIQSLQDDKDPILRFSAMYCIGMAYCGTGNNKAIRKLLHVAVSDCNDDVRRAAVTCLGFLLFRNPEQCPNAVSLLSESYNPHVRYGAALALGIACAGTGLPDAIALLEPLSEDGVDYVRQGALVALSMVCMNLSETKSPHSKTVRQKLEKAISNKHEDTLTKFGAILGQGIIDAGGRNVSISLQSRTGHTNMPTVVGLLLFSQFWYWYPMTYFISLALSPTSLIGLNKDLKMPKIEFKSNAKPSVFAYPPMTEEPKEVSKEKVSTAVLSVSVKSKIHSKKKEEAAAAAEGPTSMDVDEKKDKEKEGGDQAKKEKVKEPEFEMLQNPARVVASQLKVISFENTRYSPVKAQDMFGGIVMLRDKDPTKEEELVELSAPKASATDGAGAEGEENEPEAPEPFEYVEEEN